MHTRGGGLGVTKNSVAENREVLGLSLDRKLLLEEDKGALLIFLLVILCIELGLLL